MYGYTEQRSIFTPYPCFLTFLSNGNPYILFHFTCFIPYMQLSQQCLIIIPLLVHSVMIHNYAMLMCPIPLPTVRSSYIIMWEQLVDSTPMQIMNDSESRRYILSQDNRTLSVLISNCTDQMVFRCKVIMQRCSDPQRCPLDTIIVGPLMEFLILGTQLY